MRYEWGGYYEHPEPIPSRTPQRSTRNFQGCVPADRPAHVNAEGSHLGLDLRTRGLGPDRRRRRDPARYACTIIHPEARRTRAARAGGRFGPKAANLQPTTGGGVGCSGARRTKYRCDMTRDHRAQARPEPMTDKKLRGLLAASTLTPTQRATLAMMADAMDRNTLEIRIGMDRLAELLGVMRRAAVYRVRRLEQTGVIERLRRGGGRSESGKGYVNAWRLSLERLIPENKGATGCTVKGAKGEADCTLKGATEQRQECNEATGRVQSVAPDQKNQNTQKEKQRAATPPPPAKHGGASSPREPSGQWVNPEASRADREAQRRQQLRLQVKSLQAAQQRVGDGRNLHEPELSGTGDSGSEPGNGTGR